MASIQTVYVALFGRPADPTGLNFFNGVTNNGADLTAIGDLAATAEYQARFAGQSNTQIITSIYQSLFDRNPDQAGLDFFVAALANGTFNINNIAIAIADGAQGDDLTLLNKKVAAADLFTAALDTPDEVAAYQGSDAAAQGINFVDAVTATSAEVDAAGAQAAVDALPTSTSDQSSVLTTGPDNIQGTAADEEFSAPILVEFGQQLNTLNSVDTIEGGDGNDTLYAVFDNDAAGGGEDFLLPTINGVENLSVRNTGGNTTLDLDNTTGLTGNILVQNTDADLLIQNVNEAPTQVELNQLDADVSILLDDSIPSADGASMSIILNSVDPDADTGTPNLVTGGEDGRDGAPDQNVEIEIRSEDDAGDRFETVDLLLNGSNNELNEFSVLDDGGTLNITGSGNFEVEDALNAGVIAADGATGDLDLELNENTDLDVDTGAGDDSLAITGNGNHVVDTNDGEDSVTVTNAIGDHTINTGAGDDTITADNNGDNTIDAGEGDDTIDMGGALNDDDSIEGGDGTDSLVVSDDWGTDEVTVEGIETVVVGEADATDPAAFTLEFDALSGRDDIQTVEIQANELGEAPDSTEGVTLNDLEGDETIFLSGAGVDGNELDDGQDFDGPASQEAGVANTAAVADTTNQNLAGNIDDVTIDVDGAADNDNDSINVQIGRSGTRDDGLDIDELLVGEVTVDDIEEVSIESMGNATNDTAVADNVFAVDGQELQEGDFGTAAVGVANNIADLAGDAYTDITITGDQNLAIAAALDNGTLESIDAEDFTGNLFVQTGNGVGGTDNDGVSVESGSGNDWIVGGDNEDSINGNDGDDIIQGGAGEDDLDGGDGDDLFVYVAGGDFEADETVDGGDGSDTVVVSDSAATTIAVDFTSGDVENIEAFFIGDNDTIDVTDEQLPDDGSVAVIGEDGDTGATLDINLLDSGTYDVDDVNIADYDGLVRVTGSNAENVIIGTDNGNVMEVRGGEDDDTITFNDEDDDDVSNTVFFEGTAVDNGADTINGFEAGALATGGDVLDVTDFIAGITVELNGGTSPDITVFDTTSAGAVDIDDQIALFDNGGTALTDAQIAAEFAGGAAFLVTGGGQHVFLQGESGTVGDVSVYYIDSTLDGTVGDYTDTDVTLVGTISNLDINTLQDVNFA